MRDVSVIGAGMTDFGDHGDTLVKELIADACLEAITDAGVDRDDIGFAAAGTFVNSLFDVQGKSVGQIGLKELGIDGIPVVNVENGGATAAQAFQEAWRATASGEYDIAIAVGVEKMQHMETGPMMDAMKHAGDLELEGANGITWPGLFAMMAQRRMHEYDVTREQMAQVAINHHENARKNPRAKRPLELSVDDVLEASVIAEPLTFYECCPIADGAAAVVLASESVASDYTDSPVGVLATTQISGTYTADRDLGDAESTRRAAELAYETAGIEPDDVDVAEIHDAFSIEEIVYVEELGFCERGEGGSFVEDGQTRLDGTIPICPSGGLLAKGHPTGASGLAQICEIVWQLRGEAGERQVDDADIGLTQVPGGFVNTDHGSIFVSIFGEA